MSFLSFPHANDSSPHHPEWMSSHNGTSPIKKRSRRDKSEKKRERGERTDRAHRGRRSKTRDETRSPTSTSTPLSSTTPTATSSHDDDKNSRKEWEIEPDEIETNEAWLIGEGYFGKVYKAKWREMTVCVKKLKNVRKGEDDNFWKEVNLCAQLRFPHLVQFLAACTRPGHLCIVSEFMRGGSLYDLIHGERKCREVRTLMRIAEEVALGMHYLHSYGIVHRDLTTSNILLTDITFTAKIADFGLSRPLDAAISGQGGNLMYMAPESFLNNKYDELSDVYSFGIVLNEIFSASPPYKEMKISPALAASKAASGLRPTISPSVPPILHSLITHCWHHTPSLRPTFKTLIQLLASVSSQVCGYHHNIPSIIRTASSTSSSGSNELITQNSADENGDIDVDDTRSNPPPLQQLILTDAISQEHTKKAYEAPLTPLMGAGSPRIVSQPIPAPLALAHPISISVPSLPLPSLISTSSAPLASSSSLTSLPTPSILSIISSTSADAVLSTTSSTSTADAPPPPTLPSISKEVRTFLSCLKRSLPTTPCIVTAKPILSDTHNTTTKPDAYPDDNKSMLAALATAPVDDGRYIHTCAPDIPCRMYERVLPLVGELVMCTVSGINDGGAEYLLLEYDGVRGMAAVHELSRRRIRSLSKLVRIGQDDVLRVLRVDRDTRFVDLTKRDVTEMNKTITITFYEASKVAHGIVCKTASLMRICTQCLYQTVLWPLVPKYGNVWKCLRLALVYPTHVFNEFQPCQCINVTHFTPETQQLVVSPRMLPEIRRRCLNRTTLDLSKLGLTQLPTELITTSDISSISLPDTPTSTSTSTTTSTPKNHKSKKISK